MILSPKIQLKHFLQGKILCCRSPLFHCLMQLEKKCIEKENFTYLATKGEFESQSYCRKNEVWI